GERGRVGGEAVRCDEAGGPQRAERVLEQVARVDAREAAAREVDEAAEGVPYPSVLEADGDRVRREVAAPEVRVDRPALDLCDVDRAPPRHAEDAGAPPGARAESPR